MMPRLRGFFTVCLVWLVPLMIQPSAHADSVLDTPLVKPTTIVLKIPLVKQQQDLWCWAGCSDAVMRFYNIRVKQCKIVNWARTQRKLGRDDCCRNPSSKRCNRTNYLYAKPGSVAQILKHWGLNNGCVNRPLTRNEVRALVANHRPFIVRYQWAQGGGHVIVGHGFYRNSVWLMDPWPGNGYSISAYNWVVSSRRHRWTHTLYIKANNRKTLKLDEPKSEEVINLFDN